MEQQPASPTNYYPNRLNSPIKYIVLHSMDGTMAGTIAWFKKPRPDNPTSAHYGIGLDGRVVQFVPESACAYHAGNREINLESIGIEHEDNGDNMAPRTDAEYNASARLVADIAKRYDIPLTRQFIKKHSEVRQGPTACPGNLDIDRIIQQALALIADEKETWTATRIAPIAFQLTKPLNWYNFETGQVEKTDPAGAVITVTAKTNIFKGSTYYQTEYSFSNKASVGAKEEELYTNPVYTPSVGGVGETPTEETTPSQPDPEVPATPSPKSREQLQGELDQLVADNAKLLQGVLEYRRQLTQQDTLITELRDKVGGLESDNALIPTLQSANRILSEQIDTGYKPKIKDLEEALTRRKEDVLIEAFSSWYLVELSAVSPLRRVLYGLRIMLTPGKMVAGFKKGATMHTVETKEPSHESTRTN